MIESDAMPTRTPEEFEKAVREIQSQTLPPIEKWNPAREFELEMSIAEDGQWFYQGKLMTRKSLVKLFSTILKREDDAYYLVTPVEKAKIEVADVPFIVTDVDQFKDSDGIEHIVFITNMDDKVHAGEEHPVTMRQLKTGDIAPYIEVRAGLFARINRNVYYKLAELGGLRECDGHTELVLSSGGTTFSLGVAEAG